MEALYPQTWEEDRVVVVAAEEEEEEEEEEEDKEGGGAKETTDEETDDDLEPDRPPVGRRRVSFADAFGLNLVSVKEFSNVDMEEPEDAKLDVELIQPLEEFYLSCLFNIPFTPEELDERLEDQRLELESIALLPGTTTLRGTVRVVNLCYSKAVYVRFTRDNWKSHFELPAEYVPGSSDRKTDRFAFRYTLTPPFERDGAQVQFCLRYETSKGTFWANNKDLNYVLFCHQRAHAKEARVKEREPHVQRESPPNNHTCKRSCLKANRRGSTEERTDKMAAIATDIPETAATHYPMKITNHEDHTPLADSIRSNRRRTAGSGRGQDHLFQRTQEELKAQSVDSTNGLADPRQQRTYQRQPLPHLLGSSSSLFRIRHKKRVDERPQILTYHQIPLLTLDWSNDKTQRSGTADVNNRWTGRREGASSQSPGDNTDNAPSVGELWEAFLSGTDENMDDNTSVCDIWQAFLNGPDCKDHSGVPESEWLQTAASVSPSNHETEPRTQRAPAESGNTFQMDSDAPTPTPAPHGDTCALAPEWRPASRDQVTLLAETDLTAEEERRPAEARISPPPGGDDNVAVRDSSHVTDTTQECGPLRGAAIVSGGCADSRTGWYDEHAAQAGGDKGGIGRGEGDGGGGGGGEEEPFTPHVAELVTSSGETGGTTEMTAATAESQKASGVDRISQGARPDRERVVTGNAHNAAADTLAFRETITRETEDRERDVLFTPGRGEEERFTLNYTDNEVDTEGGGMFRPEQTEEISQAYGDEKKCKEFTPRQNNKDALKWDKTNGGGIRPERLHADAFERSHAGGADEFKSDESMRDEVVSNCRELEGFRRGQTEEDVTFGKTGRETSRKCDVEVESSQAVERHAWLNDEQGLQLNPTDTDLNRQKGDKLAFPKTPNEELGLTRTAREEHNGSEKEVNLTQTVQTEENVWRTGEREVYELIWHQTEEGTGQRCRYDGVVPTEARRQISTNGINVSVQTQEEAELAENQEASNPDHDEGFRLSEIYDESAAEPNPIERAELRWHKARDVESNKEDILDTEISPEEEDREVTEKVVMEVTKELIGDAGSTEEGRQRLSSEMKEAREKDPVIANGIKEAREKDPVIANGIKEAREKDPVIANGIKKAREKDPVIADGINKEAREKDTVIEEGLVALESGIDYGAKEAFVELTEPDLDEGILEQMSDLKDDVSAWENGGDYIGVETGGRLSDMPALMMQGLSEEGSMDAFDSGVFSLTDPDSTSFPDEGLGQDFATAGDKHSMTQSVTNIALTLSPPVTSSCVAPAKDGNTESPRLRLTQNSPSLAEDSLRQTKERSVTHHQDIYSHSEGRAASQQESFSQSPTPICQESCSPASSENKSDRSVWGTAFYSFGHVTRKLAYAFLVAVFFVNTFFYDFPLCFALQAFAVFWCRYQWKRRRAAVSNGVAR